jgi:hypothetical protein
VNWPPDPSAPLNGGAFTEGKNMRNDTLNALILRHGDRMLKDAGWPPCVDMMQIAPETMPGWQSPPARSMPRTFWRWSRTFASR